MLMACGAGALPPCPEKLGFLNFDNSGIAGEGWQTDVLWRKCSPQACVCSGLGALQEWGLECPCPCGSQPASSSGGVVSGWSLVGNLVPAGHRPVSAVPLLTGPQWGERK